MISTALAIGAIIFGGLSIVGMMIRSIKGEHLMAVAFEGNAALWFILATLLLKGG